MNLYIIFETIDFKNEKMHDSDTEESELTWTNHCIEIDKYFWDFVSLVHEFIYVNGK